MLSKVDLMDYFVTLMGMLDDSALSMARKQNRQKKGPESTVLSEKIIPNDLTLHPHPHPQDLLAKSIFCFTRMPSIDQTSNTWAFK